MPTLQITIPGAPIAKKRPRFYRRGNHVGTYNSQETEEGRFMQMLAMSLPSGWQPLDCPVSMLVSFCMPIPATTSRKKREEMLLGEIKHVKRPDIDNLQKFLKDCCNGLVWRDDSQVFHVEAEKSYSLAPVTRICLRWVSSSERLGKMGE